MISRIAVVSVTALVLSVALHADCLAQRGGRRGGGWGVGSAYNRMYDITTVETVRGEVARVEQFVPYQGALPGVHLVLTTGSESLSVHLGPAWFIENQDESIDVGDDVAVTGSRILFLGEPAIVAASVRLGEQVLQLRDRRGLPVWSGWQRW